MGGARELIKNYPLFNPTIMFQTKNFSQLPSVTVRLHAPFTLSDQQLLTLCNQYGSQAKFWKQKFLGLLPEVEKRNLYLQAGCSSVFEFAAKVGGVSREQVLLFLRLEKKFQQAPFVQAALTSGTLPLSKLSRVASVVTLQNQEFVLNQSQLLSSRALEVLVKDLKQPKGVHVHASNTNKTEKIPQFDQLQLSVQMRQRLLKLQNKGINLEELLEEFLDQREENIQHEKQKMAEGRKTSASGASKKENPKLSRYIPATVKQLLKQEHGDKCAQESCSNKATNIHHTRRFGLNPSPNPFFLAPLCKQHHEIAHALDVRVLEHRRGGRG